MRLLVLVCVLVGCAGSPPDALPPGAPPPADPMMPNGNAPVTVNDSNIIVVAFTNEIGERVDSLFFVSEDPELPATKLVGGDTIVAAPDVQPIPPEIQTFVDALNVAYVNGVNFNDGHLWNAVASTNTTGFVRVVDSAATENQYVIEGYGPRTMWLMATQRLQPDAGITQPVTVGVTLDLGDKAAVDYSGTELYNADGVTLTLTSATLSNHPTINTSIEFEGHSLSTLELSLADHIGAQLVATVDVSGSYDHDVKTTLFATNYTLPPQLVAGIPVVETIRFGVDAHCHITTSGSAALSMGVTVGEDFTLGGAYASGAWSNTSSIMEPTFTPSGPTLVTSAEAKLSCELLPKFTLLFYDVIGPYISVTPSTNLTITASNTSLDWTLDAAVDGELGVEAAPGWAGAALLQKWVGLDAAKVDLFSKSATLSSGSL